MRPNRLIQVLLVMAACAPEPPPPVMEVEPPVAQIQLSRDEVIFAPVEVGVDPPATGVIEVDNLGDAPLFLYALRLEGADHAMFSVARMEAEATVVDPGHTTDVAVRFDPYTSGHYLGELVIHSSDPTSPEVRVPLHGQGVAPVADADPLDFGSWYIGCECRQEVEVRNAGTSDLTVHEVELISGSGEVALVGELQLPLVVPKRESVGIEVRYQPLDEFDDVAWLVVRTSDPCNPELWVEVSGDGIYYGEGADEFAQSAVGSADILFTLDRSGSMADDNALVVANFATFLNTLHGLEADYHVAVAVEDDGCFLGTSGYITPAFSLAQAENAFEQMADVYITLGTYGANTERGFSLAEAALKSSNISSGGCNEGFAREDAILSIVHVSDEPEQSVNPYTYYVSLFQGMKSDPDDAVIHAVAGDYPGGCGSASPGTGYYEATVATGGVFLSICATDWGSHLESIAEGSVGLKFRFELSQLPVGETIEVWVDGVRAGGGWEYDASLNAVVFERDHVPAAGSDIGIFYQLMPDCECS